MSTFFNNLESYGLFLIYKMLIWTSRNIPNVGLFSAYAEVFRSLRWLHGKCLPFLCLRRGVSAIGGAGFDICHFSLPTQRCFHDYGYWGQHGALFSAYAEVFLIPPSSGSFTRYFSLPTQRCFQPRHGRPDLNPLFSAYAEVFLGLLLRGRTPGTFLCLRRGVSKKPEDLSPGSFFSLPTQRCFRW